ncbi:MAG: phosphoribosylamine--glycine ligase, partial [Halobacteriovoraceae bacterium]|nr:phosphoribosylamine--glycine ligase [Halobacteriovoraceae bacterium]
MNILLLGGGGREHALAWKIKKSSQVDNLYVLPGNDGMRMAGISCLPGDVNDHALVVKTAGEYGIDLVISGPEKPLAMGIANLLRKEGIPVVGPDKKAALLESSKIFAKEFMDEFDIPTASWQAFYDHKKAYEAIDRRPEGPIVVKADCLAGGKGVVVAKTRQEAGKAVFDFTENPACSVKTQGILLEECLQGRELSAFALCDGENFITLGFGRDYKRVGDDDQGANTGGMGCVGDARWPTPQQKKIIEDKIFRPVIRGMQKRGTPYQGILFAGLMVDGEKIKVIEFNVRLGDPETQILMPLIKNDLVPYLMACSAGNLSSLPPIELIDKSAIHVVMASQNYPSVDGTPLLTGGVIDYPENLLDTSGEGYEYLFFSGVK